MSIAVILPALNEEKAIGAVITEVRALSFPIYIVVADNGSTDRTMEVAMDSGADEVVTVTPRGKGNAIRAAIARVSQEYVFMLNSDRTYPPRYIGDMLPILQSGYDCVVGERQITSASMDWVHRFANKVFNSIVLIAYGGRTGDLCSGMLGFRGEVLKDLELTACDFTLEADIFTKLCEKNYKLARLPIEYRRRVGRSKIKVRDGLNIMRVLWERSLK